MLFFNWELHEQSVQIHWQQTLKLGNLLNLTEEDNDVCHNLWLMR